MPEGSEMTDHTPPHSFPPAHYVAVAVPRTFADVVIETAARNHCTFEDQILAFAQTGAEHMRLCERKQTRTGRKK